MPVDNLIKYIKRKNKDTSLKIINYKCKLKYNKFNRNVYLAKEFMTNIKNNFLELKLLILSFENDTYESSEIIKMDIKYIENKINKNIRDVSAQINILEREIKKEENLIKNESDNCENEDSSELQLKKIFFNVIKLKLSELTSKNQSIQMDLKSKIKTKICDKIALFNPNLNEDEIQELYQNKQFDTHLTRAKNSTKLKNELEDIKSKYQEIEQLEEQIKELHDIVSKISNIIFSQSAKINSIKENMICVKDHLKESEGNLKVSKKEYLEYREKVWCLMSIVLIFSLFVFLLIYKILF